jgi:hypothetical protein
MTRECRKFPAFARGIGMRGTVKFHAPSVGEPIVIAGVAIAPGDLVVATPTACWPFRRPTSRGPVRSHSQKIQCRFAGLQPRLQAKSKS